MKNDIMKFYDTCALLEAGELAFNEDFIISNITLKELERIKVAANKDADIKYAARVILRLCDETSKSITVLHSQAYEEAIPDTYEINDDLRILSDAIWYQSQHPLKEIIFITNDLSLKAMATIYFPGQVDSIKDTSDNYKGFKEVCPDEELLTKFYQEPTNNTFNLLTNEYLIIRDTEGKVIDIRVWTGFEYRYLKSQPYTSTWFGKVEPFKHDIY